MEIKILQVFYDKNGLPYKDKERAVHYPITSGTFLGASNTTEIRFYYDQLDELNESTFVAVSKLPNGKIGSEILESEYDSELQESYAVLNLSQFYTQYKGDVFISLQGYQGGVRVEQDEDGIYQIYGTPTIQATGSIKLSIAYAPTFIGSGQTENITLQRVLAELSTKLGIRQETLHVEELPTIGNPNIWYVINNDTNDPNKVNIYIWNENTQHYVWVGDNTLDLGEYYTKAEGETFEENIENRVLDVENELSSVASGSPKGVYANLAALQAAYPTGATGIYVVQDTGYWYYWNGSAWTSGGTYLSSTDYDDLKEDLEESGVAIECDISNPNQYYVNQNGNYVASASNIYSINVELKKGDKIVLFGWGYYTYVSVIAIKEKNVSGYPYTTLVLSIDNNKHSYSYVANKDMEVAVSFRTVVGGASVKNRIVKIVNNATRFDNFVSNLVKNSNNLLNPETCYDNISIDSSSGAISNNTDRWSTDFIEVDETKRLLISPRVYIIGRAYKEDKTDNGPLTITAQYPINIPTNTKYIRLCFIKTTWSYEDRYSLFVGYADNVTPVNNRFYLLNNELYGIRNNGYFDISNILKYSVNNNNVFTSSFEYLLPRCENSYKNMIMTCRARYEGNNAPTIQFVYTVSKNYSDADSVFASTKYVIGAKEKDVTKEWRIPPFPKFIENLEIRVNIPSETTLYIENIDIEYSNATRSIDNCGVRFNAHQGFIQLNIPDTLTSFDMAAKLGFNCCITIPKRTSDGVWVCFHDDGAIGNVFADENGLPLSSELQNTPISELTYSQLIQWHYESFTNIYPIWTDRFGIERIATLEDFFRICSKTGMHPMLSCHPRPTSSEWLEIKNLAKKYNLLDKLNIKVAPNADGSAITLPHSILGDDIESYTIDVSTSNDFTDWMLEYAGNFNTRVGIEYFYNVITEDKINNALSNGFFVACAEMRRAVSSEYEALISLGVTEFTSDYFASVGLNW